MGVHLLVLGVRRMSQLFLLVDTIVVVITPFVLLSN